uniref:Nicotinic acetylcholine receptor beta 3 subunit n=1 Tax=Bombyx mori TaxID=7091 RepID=A8HTE3_BOMMO|nr:nicotinic acetylcholine receptor beta 3 subunit [Bombyx mori]
MIRTVYISSLLVVLCRCECVIDHSSDENNWEQKLQKDLKANYDISQPPFVNRTFEVMSFIVIDSYALDSGNDRFEVTGSLILNWMDDRLRWNRSEYAGIADTVMRSAMLWLPGFRQVNAVGAGDDDVPFYTLCRVSSSGKVECKLKSVFTSRCRVDLRNWPLDVQQCDLEFGAWKGDKVLVRVKFPNQLYISEVTLETHWRLTDWEMKHSNESEVQTVWTYTLERQTRTLAAILVLPAVVLSLLSASCFLVDVKRTIRLLLCCFSHGCHYRFLSQLQQCIPKHAEDPPALLLLYRGSLVVSVLLIMLSIVLRWTATKDTVVPQPLSTMNKAVMCSRWKMLIWPQWHSSSESTCNKEWTHLANTMNSIALGVTFVVYAILFILFLPR